MRYVQRHSCVEYFEVNLPIFLFSCADIKVESTAKVKDELTSPDLSPTTSISPLNTPPLSTMPSAAEDGMPDLVQPVNRAAQITST